LGATKVHLMLSCGRLALAEIRDAATPRLFARLRQDADSGPGVRRSVFFVMPTGLAGM